jgi:polar amino acid transport system substrate-binding protein
MWNLAILFIGSVSFLGFMTGGATQISNALRSEIAPTGVLRVGINFGNTLLAGKDDKGVPTGIAVDLAQELAKQVGTSLVIVEYDSAGRMADGVKTNSWDVAFLATDTDREAEIAFSPPYLEVDSTYLVPTDSALRTVADVDHAGVRIAVSDKSAYDLFLTRNLKSAELVRIPGVAASVDMFFAKKLNALAALRPVLVDIAEKQTGVRVLDGKFTVVQQAVGAPKGRVAAAKYIREFVESVKASGMIEEISRKNGVRGVSVPE